METISWKSKGIEMDMTHMSECVGEVVTIHGSVYKIRKMSGFSFILLRTARYILQCVCDRQEILEQLEEEMCVELTAEVVREERARAGAELHIRGVKVLSSPCEQMPIVMNQKRIEASLENKLDHRPLTLRNEKERAVFRIQEGLLKGFRRFFEAQGFTEIHSPKIVYAGAEGGANIFKLDYFGREAYLAQSPQFYKQMAVGIFERVYEIGPVFRAEKHDTARHLNEYTGVDLEMGYIESFHEIMEAEAGMLWTAFELLREEYAYELELLQVKLPQYGGDGPEIPVLKFAEAKELLRKRTGKNPKGNRSKENCSEENCSEGDGQEGNCPVGNGHEAGHDFEPEEERLLSEIILQETGSDLVFVTHYPSDKRPFYAMDDPENPEETLSFDLLFRGLEITTGGQRIHDYDMQVEKMRKRGMEIENFESYLTIHRHGMPPHGGLGLGLERLTARLLGFDNVRQASLFPRDIHRLEP